MTLEEAAEIILAGEAWISCTVCFGAGHVHKTTVEIGDPVYLNADGAGYSIKTCNICKGQGGAVCLAYQRACELLGKTPNVRTWVTLQNPIGKVVGTDRGTYDVELSEYQSQDHHRSGFYGGPTLGAGRMVTRMKMNDDL